jgi:hypothetical protein
LAYSLASDLNFSKIEGSRDTVSALEEQASVLLQGEKLPSFADFVLDFDQELADNPAMQWCRSRLFKLFCLSHGVDIDSFAPPVNKKKEKQKGKEEKEVAA